MTAFAPDAVSVGALPDWIVDEAAAPARAVAEVALRRALFPQHPLSFVEPAAAGSGPVTWHALASAMLADAGGVDLILRSGPGSIDAVAAETVGAAAVAVGLRESRDRTPLTGPALAHAVRSVAAAEVMLAAARGWRVAGLRRSATRVDHRHRC